MTKNPTLYAAVESQFNGAKGATLEWGAQRLPKARIPPDFLSLFADLQRLPGRVTVLARGAVLLPSRGDLGCKANGAGAALHGCEHFQRRFTAGFVAFESYDESNQVIGVSGSILGIELQQSLRHVSP